MKTPKRIDLCEVGPRDGLQNESTILTSAQKAELINLAVEAGYKRIEIGSLMHPKAVPAMADTEIVFELIDKKPDIEYQALITNTKGVQRAIDAGISKVKLSVSASNTHNLNNFNRTTEESVKGFVECCELALKNNISVAGGIATAFGCPFEGKIEVSKIEKIIQEYIKMGISEISLADTTGMANPKQVYEVCSYLKEQYPNIQWSLHLHNTRDMGLANVLAGLYSGVEKFDSSFSALGGCPYAPGATGNICSEDLINMCDEMGIESGVNLDNALDLSKKVGEFIGHSTDSFMLKAGKIQDLAKRPSNR